MPLHGQGLVRTPPFWFLVLCLASNPTLQVALRLLLLLGVVLAAAATLHCLYDTDMRIALYLACSV